MRKSGAVVSSSVIVFALIDLKTGRELHCFGKRDEE